MKMNRGEKIMAELLGDIPRTDMPVLTESHPFLRKVIAFMQTREYWLGTATSLLREAGDRYTPANTAARLLRGYGYEFLYRKHGIDVSFRRTSRKRLIELHRL